MSRDDYKKYFDILELSSDASPLEVKTAYIRLKKLYSTPSMFLSPIADEFPKRERQEILEQIEEAYTKLVSFLNAEQAGSFSSEKSSRMSAVEEERSGDLSYSGPMLKQIREKAGIELFDVALETKIRMEILQNIELEKFDSLPQEVYLKGHLNNYASYLFLDPKKVVVDYLRRYRAWKNSTKGRLD